MYKVLKLHRTFIVKKNKQFRSLEDTLSLIQIMTQKGPITLGRVIKIFSYKTECFFLFILSLFLLCSFSITSINVILGLVTIWIGIGLTFSLPLWLPDSLLERKLPRSFVKKSAKWVSLLVKKTRGLIHPRMEALCHHNLSRFINGSVIFLLGVLLILFAVLTVPTIYLSVSLVFFSLGLLEDDGFLVLMGYIELAFAVLLFFLK